MGLRKAVNRKLAVRRAMRHGKHSLSAESRSDRISGKNIFAIGILISGGFITFFNQTVLGPAIPTIMEEYSIDASTAQWLTTIFLLVNGVMVPVTAFLIDRFSTRSLFVVSMGLFTLGALLVAAAPSFLLVLGGRVLQAMGAGIQFPLGTVCMMRIFPIERRGFAMGIVGIVINFAPAIGPTLSGLVMSSHSWHLLFWYIAGAAVLDIVFALIFLENIGEKKDVKLDFLSIVLSTIAFGGLLFGLSYAGSYGWVHALVIAPIVVGGVTLVFFSKRQNRLEEPFLELALLKKKNFAVSTIVIMIVNAALMVGTVITPIYIQNVLGESAFVSGLAMMPGAIVMCILSPIAGTLFDRIGPRKLSLVGTFTLAAASLYMCLMTEHMSVLLLIAAYMVRAAGITLVNMPVNTWGINALTNAEIAHGNAICNTGRQMAGSLGTALLVTVMSMVSAFLASGGTETLHATCRGINAAFGGSTLLAACAFVMVFIFVDRKKSAKPDRSDLK